MNNSELLEKQNNIYRNKYCNLLNKTKIINEIRKEKRSKLTEYLEEIGISRVRHNKIKLLLKRTEPEKENMLINDIDKLEITNDEYKIEYKQFKKRNKIITKIRREKKHNLDLYLQEIKISTKRCYYILSLVHN